MANGQSFFSVGCREAAKTWIQTRLVLSNDSALPKHIVDDKYRDEVFPRGCGILSVVEFRKEFETIFPSVGTITKRGWRWYKGVDWASPEGDSSRTPDIASPQSLPAATANSNGSQHTNPPSLPMPPVQPSQPTRRRARRSPHLSATVHVHNQPSTAQSDLGLRLSALRTTVTTLRRVPRGARSEVSAALASVLRKIVSDNSEESWEALLLFPYVVLAVPSKSDGVRNLTTWVKSRVRLWSDEGSTAVTAPPVLTGKRACRPEDLAKKIEAKLSDGDVRGSLRLLESDDTVAPNDAVTLAALREKHPPHPEPTNYPAQPDPMPIVEPTMREEVLKGVASFPPGSAGGLDSLRPQILKDCLSSQAGDAATELANVMRDFLDVVLNGQVPEPVRPIFFGAALTALIKKTGGIRPIAVGSTWRRLAAKVLLARMNDELVQYLAPHQLGVGVRAGAEIGAHAARAYFAAAHPALRLFLKIDFRNAFNLLRRDKMLAEVLTRFPGAFPFLRQAYQYPSLLFFGLLQLLSQCGLHQGDPAAAALFALLLHPIVRDIEAELNIWFLDDGTIAGEPEDVFTALRMVIDRALQIGLELNPQKCEFALLGPTTQPQCDRVREELNNLLPGIIEMQPEHTTLLGSPLTDEALECVLVDKTNKLKDLSSRLRALSKHSAFFLFRTSISTPRLIYFLRCAPAFMKTAQLTAYDAVLKAVLEDILNCCLSQESWLQTSLPVKLGGLGVRHAVEVAIPCFIASTHSTLSGVTALLPDHMSTLGADVEEAMDRWSAMVMPQDRPADAKRGSQEAWEQPLFALILSQLRLAATSPPDAARLLAIAQPEAGAWLNVLPSPQLGTHLSNESFRVSVGLRLGCDLCQPHTCPCGKQVCSKGYHGLACSRSAGRHSRQATANDVISRALRSAEVPNIREPPGCSRSDGKRPDGLSLVPYKRGRSLIWDFTCVDTVAPSHLATTSSRPGSAAEDAVVRKRRKYAALEGQFLFVPIAVETFGAWASESLRFLRELGSRLVTATDEKRASTFLLQRMSLAVQRGNVASILGTLPSGADFNEIFMF